MTPPFKAHKLTDIIQFKVKDFTKKWNKDMIPGFEGLEKMRFVGHQKAYNYVCEKYGSAFLECCVDVYINSKMMSHHDLKL